MDSRKEGYKRSANDLEKRNISNSTSSTTSIRRYFHCSPLTAFRHVIFL